MYLTGTTCLSVDMVLRMDNQQRDFIINGNDDDDGDAGGDDGDADYDDGDVDGDDGDAVDEDKADGEGHLRGEASLN